MNIYLIVPDREKLPNQEQIQLLQKAGKVIVVKHSGPLSKITKIREDKELKILGVDPDVFNWDLDAESIKNIPNVKAVCTSSTSFDWIKPEILKKLGVIGCNCPGFSSDSVAEYSLAMAIEVARRSSDYIKNNWTYSYKQNPMPFLLKGKTVGIIGLGRIGKRMAELFKNIGMNVIYWSRKSTDKRFVKVELKKLFKTADIILPALVENEETKKIVTNENIDLMKTTACLIGINRVRAIWDERYVLNKVAKKEIGGYAFEGDGVKSPKAYKGNVWTLPAMIWFTKDALDTLMQIWVEDIISVANGKPQNRVV